MRQSVSDVWACVSRGDDLRVRRAHAAFAAIVERKGAVISIGGGPTRVHPRLINLNILIERGVDVTATAYALPFRALSITALHCEAVLEHLEFPDNAVREMFRVAAPDALVLAVTPFLQPYHGYPDHYQNFTLRGHVRLFERAGFAIVDSGTCVGPTFAIVDLAANYARELVPTRLLSRALERAIRVAGRLLRVLDLRARDLTSASQLASTTFVLARKVR
jgi:SAM-dependent methyltransferase